MVECNDQSEDMYAVTCQSESRHTPLVVPVLSRPTDRSASFLGPDVIILQTWQPKKTDHLGVDGVRCDCAGCGSTFPERRKLIRQTGFPCVFLVEGTSSIE